jgi:hypothetical protein
MVQRAFRWIKTPRTSRERNPSRSLALSPLFVDPALVAAAKRLRGRAGRSPSGDDDGHGSGLATFPTASSSFSLLLSQLGDTSWSTRQRRGTEEEPAPLWPPCRRVRALVGARTAVKRLSGGALCLCPLLRWCSSSPCLGLPMRMEIERNGRGLVAVLLCRRARGLFR